MEKKGWGNNLANEEAVELYPGDDPSPVELQASLSVTLHVLVGVAQLGDQDVQQHHAAREQEDHHQDTAQRSVRMATLFFRVKERLKASSPSVLKSEYYSFRHGKGMAEGFQPKRFNLSITVFFRVKKA